MKPLSAELKVGVFALAVLTVLSYMTFKVGDIDLFRTDGYTVHVYLTNLAGIENKSRVKVAGVDAGVIESVVLQDGKVRATVKMYEGVRLYSDAAATVRFTGLLGDKFLEIRPGSKAPLLKAGDHIAEQIEPMDMDNLVQNLAKVSGDIAQLSSGLNELMGHQERQALRETIVSFKETTQAFQTAIAANDERLRVVLTDLDQLIRSLQGFLGANNEAAAGAVANLRDVTATLNREGPVLMDSLQLTSQELRRAVDVNGAALRTLLLQLNVIVERVNSGEGTLGRLVNDDRLYWSLEDAAGRLSRVLRSFERSGPAASSGPPSR